MFFFFFQAEDGIRDDLVTGVQTCALPIFGMSTNGKINWSATSIATGTIAARPITIATNSERRAKVASVATTMTGAIIPITITTTTATSADSTNKSGANRN